MNRFTCPEWDRTRFPELSPAAVFAQFYTRITPLAQGYDAGMIVFIRQRCLEMCVQQAKACGNG